MPRLRNILISEIAFLASVVILMAIIWGHIHFLRPFTAATTVPVVCHSATCPCGRNRTMTGEVKSVVHTDRDAWDEMVSPPIVHRMQSDIRTSCGADAKKPLPSEQ